MCFDQKKFTSLEPIFKKIINRIETYKKIVICGHIRPDGDAIGSSQALAIGLRSHYPEKKIYTPFVLTNKNLKILKPKNNDVTNLDWSDVLLILVDCDTISRTDFPNVQPAEYLIIDHHKVIAPPGIVAWIDSKRIAAVEMIYDFLYYIREAANPKIAPFVYAGLCTDSGNFVYPGVSSHTFQILSKLFKESLNYVKIQGGLMAKNREDVAFYIYLLKNLQWKSFLLFFDYCPTDQKKIVIDKKDVFSRYIGGFVGYVDLKAWAFFIQVSPNSPISVDLRSQGNYDVSKIATKYGGGGHLNAAGAKIKKWTEVEEIKILLKKLVNDH